MAIREYLHDRIKGIKSIKPAGGTDNEVDALRGICIMHPNLVILNLILNDSNNMGALHKIT